MVKIYHFPRDKPTTESDLGRQASFVAWVTHCAVAKPSWSSFGRRTVAFTRELNRLGLFASIFYRRLSLVSKLMGPLRLTHWPSCESSLDQQKRGRQAFMEGRWMWAFMKKQKLFAPFCLTELQSCSLFSLQTFYRHLPFPYIHMRTLDPSTCIVRGSFGLKEI